MGPSARDESVDCVGGTMILFMVFRHCVIPGDVIDKSLVGGAILYYPLMFFMAWFFFKGGMFFHNVNLQTTIVKGINRLLIPYLLFSFIAVFFAIIVYGCCDGKDAVIHYLCGIPTHLKREGAVEFNTPLWFLPSLFLSRTFFSFSKQLHIKERYVAVVSFLFAFVLYILDLPIGIYFENIALGLLFFSLGSIFRDLQFDRHVFYLSLGYYAIFLCYSIITRSVEAEFMVNRQNPYFLTVLFYLSGCIVINNIFRRVTLLQVNFLKIIGRNSMIIYVTHFILLSSILAINNSVWGISGLRLFILLIGVLLLIMPFVFQVFSSQRLSWITGNSKTHSFSLNSITVIASTSLLALAMLAYVILHIIRAL